jgi:1,4-dihydroxy-2-naphthoyl-CoA synthase
MATPRTNGSSAARAQPIGESVQTLERDTRELLSAIEQLSASASDALRTQLDRRPYATLGAGLVAGYVIGGGLSLRLATILAAAAGRATIAQLVARGVSRATTRGGGRP